MQKKAFDRVQHPLMTNRNRGKLSQLDREYLQKLQPTPCIMGRGWNLLY